MEVDAEADGSVVAKVDKMLLRPKLVHNALAVASTDTMHRSVLKVQVHPAVAILHSVLTSAITLRRFAVREEEQEETVEADDGLVFPELMSFMTPREMSTRLMKMAISS